MRYRLPALAAFLALVACIALGCDSFGISAATPVPPSGIKGTVVLGPTCAVGGDVSQGDAVPSACLTPYAAQLVVLDGENNVVKRITSGNDGTFSVDLDPGDYVIAPATGTDQYPFAQPVSVTVSPGEYVTVQINYDTGER